MPPDDAKASWDEADSQDFIDYGAFFVPDREEQIAILCDLVPPAAPGAAGTHLVELCCGEGLLSGALLERFPEAQVHAYDGSTAMLETAAARLARHGERFAVQQFDLADRGWRHFPWPVHAVLSSLAVHHLDGPGKAALFADLHAALAPGGVLLLADLVLPVHAQGHAVAARCWDEAVRQRAGGDPTPYEIFRREGWNYYTDPDPLDRPSPLFAQLQWLAAAGFSGVDVFWMKAGHAIYGGIKGGDR
ncbi:MAG TPA: class I SAM-dependent methyltransferase [Thermoanaerobaculia bacterium]|jgi:tRNA (cmo5U34)-methyltransferase|nr:class I SAM-dependent methyltransferase [Thermoanaerobaculia bacterium]